MKTFEHYNSALINFSDVPSPQSWCSKGMVWVKTQQLNGSKQVDYYRLQPLWMIQKKPPANLKKRNEKRIISGAIRDFPELQWKLKIIVRVAKTFNLSPLLWWICCRIPFASRIVLPAPLHLGCTPFLAKERITKQSDIPDICPTILDATGANVVDVVRPKYLQHSTNFRSRPYDQDHPSEYRYAATMPPVPAFVVLYDYLAIPCLILHATEYLASPRN